MLAQATMLATMLASMPCQAIASYLREEIEYVSIYLPSTQEACHRHRVTFDCILFLRIAVFSLVLEGFQSNGTCVRTYVRTYVRYLRCVEPEGRKSPALHQNQELIRTYGRTYLLNVSLIRM